jgi:molybdopterin-guanine dinucleotide biosynthesis protein A
MITHSPNPEQPSIAAVVLAGGETSEAFQAVAGAAHRALARVGDRTMIEVVLAALHDTRRIAHTVLIGGPELSGVGPVETHLPPAESLVANVMGGLRACEGYDYALLVTADLPFLTAEAVNAMLVAGVATGAGFCYPAIRKEENERMFPGMHRTYARLADGTFTGGNLFLTRPSVLLAQEERVARAYAMRKKPWRLASLFGLSFIWRLWRGTLTLAALEARASEVFEVPVRVLVLPYPQLGADIDRPEDLEVARRLLAERAV